MKKILIILLIVCTLCLVGCKDKNKSKRVIEDITGGWEMNSDVEKLDIPKEASKAFDKAYKNYKDMELEPITLLGTQVVAGTNYMFLCKSDKTWQVVVVYKDLKDKASITSVKELDYTLYTGKDMDFDSEEVTGGWEVNKNQETGKIDKDINEIFNKALKEYTGMELKPVTVLGTQLVAGNNYAVLALGSKTTKKKDYSMEIVTIYKDLEDNAELTSIAYLDLATFNE